VTPDGVRPTACAQQAIFRKADTANGAKAVVEPPLEAIPGAREGEGQFLLRGDL
jgi:hypothetical protein